MNIVNFAIGRFSIQQPKNRAGDGFGIRTLLVGARQMSTHIRREVIARSKRRRLTGNIPVLEIESPDQHRQLLAHVDGILQGKVIAQCM